MKAHDIHVLNGYLKNMLPDIINFSTIR